MIVYKIHYIYLELSPRDTADAYIVIKLKHCTNNMILCFPSTVEY